MTLTKNSCGLVSVTSSRMSAIEACAGIDVLAGQQLRASWRRAARWRRGTPAAAARRPSEALLERGRRHSGPRPLPFSTRNAASVSFGPGFVEQVQPVDARRRRRPDGEDEQRQQAVEQHDRAAARLRRFFLSPTPWSSLDPNARRRHLPQGSGQNKDASATERWGCRTIRCWAAQATLRKISEALVPPKPKEFDSATSICFLTGTFGTRLIGVSTDGLSRLSVGGAMLSRMASSEKIASIEPAAPSRCPIADLVEDIAALLGRIAEQPRHRAELDLVAERRRGAVGVDVVDVGRARCRRASPPSACSG